MVKDRLQDLYERKLLHPETSPKELPLDKILERSVKFFPEEPDSFDFDFVEIGPGGGEFLFHLAESHPDKKILAIEIGFKRFKKISERLVKRNIKNVHLICGDARIPFHKMIPNNSLEKCFVLFPDPWPKNRHRHLRLLQKDFLRLLTQKLKPGGSLTHATDVFDYANWVLNSLKTLPEMQSELKDEISNELPDIIPTFFKKKWERLGRDFHYLRFKKNRVSTTPS